MPKVRECVTLHPETVSNSHLYIVGRKSGTKKNGSLEMMKVDERVWTAALKIAGGDAKRIVVHSETEVVVVNHPQNRRRV